MSGVRKEPTKAFTTAVKAAPMTTATARSTTFPRSRKSLNPLIMGSSTHTGSDPAGPGGHVGAGEVHREGGGGRGRRQTCRSGVVHGDEQQAAGLDAGVG